MSALNWIDVLMIGIMIRMFYVGVKTSFFIELFKLLGVVFAIFITHHYYDDFGKLLHQRVHFAPIFADTVSFALLWIVVVLIFKLVRDALLLLFKMHANPAIDQWGGFIVALSRGVLLCSLTFMLVYVSGVKYLVKYANRSLSGPYLRELSLDVYQGCFEGFVSKFFERENLNIRIFEVRDVKDDHK